MSRLSRLSRFSGEERGALVSVSLPIFAPSSVTVEFDTHQRPIERSYQYGGVALGRHQGKAING